MVMLCLREDDVLQRAVSSRTLHQALLDPPPADPRDAYPPCPPR